MCKKDKKELYKDGEDTEDEKLEADRPHDVTLTKKDRQDVKKFINDCFID